MEWFGKIITSFVFLFTSIFGSHNSIDGPAKNLPQENQKSTQISYASSTKELLKKEQVSTSQDLVFNGDVDEVFSFFTYGNFLIPYPKGWEVFLGASHKGHYLNISSKENPSKIRLQFHLEDQNRFVGGQDEIYEDSLKDKNVHKVREFYLTGLKRNISEFSKKNDPSSAMYTIFTDYGGLSVVAYIPADTKILLEDGSEITDKGFTDLLLNNIAIVATATPVISTDSENKKYLGSHLSSDEKYVYYYNTIIAGADPKTFRFVDTTSNDTAKFGFDKYSVYGPYSGYNYLIFKKLEGADPLTFNMLGQGYAMDKNNVFYYKLSPSASSEDGPYLYQIVPGADSSSFKLVSGSSSVDAQDKYHSYIEGISR
jgi:hypothetical protein